MTRETLAARQQAMRTRNQHAPPSVILSGVELLSEQQFADSLGVNIRTIRRWRKNGRAPKHVMLGRFFYFTREAIAAFLAESTEEK